MTLRSQFPDTQGAYVVAEGNPLVEILADGTNVNVKSRPTGFTGAGDLANEGDRAAFTYQMQRYFFGLPAADAFKRDTLSMFTPPVRPVPATPEQTKHFDEVEANLAKDRADFDRAMSTGVFNTPTTPAVAVGESSPSAVSS